ncbi:MAG TPA: hypothetical protein EYP53_07095 [Candidatus Latescibacteria bacterium]|nr:hypothetical protein [Candidatus Latescibacterota bacterium]
MNMFASLRRLLKHSLIYGLGYGLSRFVGFLLLPLYTNYLLPQDYGIAALLLTFLAISNVLFSYGLNTAFLRFYVLADDPEEKRSVFSTTYCSIFVSTLLFSFLILFSAGSVSRLIFRLEGYGDLVKLASGILFFDTLALFPLLILRAKERSTRFIVMNLVNTTSNLALNIFFIAHLGWGVEGIFISNLISSSLLFLLLTPLIAANIKATFSKGVYRELLKFGLPYIPSTLAVILMDLVDRFLLDRLTDAATVGLYSAGYKLGMFMALVVSGFRFAWHPFFLSTSKQEGVQPIFARVLTYFLLVTGFLFLLISFFIDDVVRLSVFGFTILGRSYWEGTRVVPPVLLSYIMYGVYVNFLVGVYLEKKTHYLPFITGAGAAVNIAGNLVLIPILGMMGAAYSTLIAYSLMAVLLYLFAKRIYPVRYEYLRILKVAVACAILFSLSRIGFSGSQPSLLSIHTLYRLLLLIAYPFVLYILRFYETSEINKVKTIMSLKSL